jgi:hypothetical protein
MVVLQGSVFFIIDAFDDRAAILARSAKIEKQLQLISQELQIVQVLLDLSQLAACEQADFVSSMLWVLAHLQKLGNLLETEFHFLCSLNKSQSRQVTLDIDTDPGVGPVDSGEQADLFVVAQRVGANTEQPGDLSDAIAFHILRPL